MQNEKNSTRSFTTVYADIHSQLRNDATLISGERQIRANALWDTGATSSCVSYRVVEELKLQKIGERVIHTPSGLKTVNTYITDILLPNNFLRKDVLVCDSDIGEQGIDLLIGMDIITLGDFAVTNYNGSTMFSFRIPSVKRIDFVMATRFEQIKGQPHGKGKKQKKKKK